MFNLVLPQVEQDAGRAQGISATKEIGPLADWPATCKRR